MRCQGHLDTQLGGEPATFRLPATPLYPLSSCRLLAGIWSSPSSSRVAPRWLLTVNRAHRDSTRGGRGYLVGALAHGVDELLDHHVHTLHARLLQLHHLLLHDGLKGHVGGEQARPTASRTHKKASAFHSSVTPLQECNYICIDALMY